MQPAARLLCLRLQMVNQAALALVQRFMHNKREFDGTPTRDRFKLIPRIVNVAEWAEEGPLSGARALPVDGRVGGEAAAVGSACPPAAQLAPTGWPPRSLAAPAHRHMAGPTVLRAALFPRASIICPFPPGTHAGYEHRLLMNYNDKPLLTRPQQRFYTGGWVGGRVVCVGRWVDGWVGGGGCGVRRGGRGRARARPRVRGQVQAGAASLIPTLHPRGPALAGHYQEAGELAMRDSSFAPAQHSCASAKLESLTEWCTSLIAVAKPTSFWW